MIQMTVDVQDMFSRELAQFGKRGPAIALRICRTIGMGYRSFVKKNYLRGQVLGKRTGTLYKGIKIVTDRKSRNAVVVKPWAKLANIYHKPGGATIEPKKAKVLRFEVDGKVVFAKRVHLKERPWTGPSYAAFPWGPEIEKASDKVIAREVAKMEAKRGAG